MTFALGLGANLDSRWGSPERTLAAALSRLRQALGPLRVAALYRTAPLSPVAQPPFFNTAALGTTTHPPEAVLALGKELEVAAGRPAPGTSGALHHGPRPLDVDLLLYGDLVTTLPGLTLPHPGLRHRRFVLAPLADLAPDLRVPPDGERIGDLLAELGDEQEVERLEWRER